MPDPEIVKGFSAKVAVGNDALGVGAVDHLPQFPDRCVLGKILAEESLKTPAAPDALHGEWFERDG
jgi:hypothetical protein